jgi:alpha-glucosidase
MARRNGDKWYVGGLVGHDARTVSVDLGFLGEGEWKVELFKDGINATRHAEDYVRTEAPAGQSLTVEMVPGGGFAAILTR